jgi:hypothetical protein
LEILLTMAWGALLVIGLVLVVIAQRHRMADHPQIISFNPRDWKPIWRMQNYFDPIGFRLNLVGWILVILSAVCSILLGRNYP